MVVQANDNEQKVTIEKLKSELQNTQEALHEMSIKLETSKKEHLEDIRAKNNLLNMQQDITEKDNECKCFMSI